MENIMVEEGVKEQDCSAPGSQNNGMRREGAKDKIQASEAHPAD